MTDKEVMQMALDALEAALSDDKPYISRSAEAIEALRTALAQPEKTDMQIGITYEKANPPEPYCKRCGKKLGTEVYDVHTCTPKRDFKFSTIEEAMQPMPTPKMQPQLTNDEARFANAFITLQNAGYGKEAEIVLKCKPAWVGLTKEEVENWNLPEGATVFEFVQFVEAKLKDKNL